MIPQGFIAELLSRVDVVDVVGQFVQLKKGGANLSGLCPFHGEKSPSFTVSPAKQFFHCFGCGKSGNAIRFLMEHAGMSFVEAVKDLAAKHGLQVPDEGRSPGDRARIDRHREQQATLLDVLARADMAYRAQLRQAPEAIAYLVGRGVSGELAKRFGLGYAREGWRTLANVFPDYADPLLVEAGLVLVDEGQGRRYDRFRGRVMFPIRNIKGECIGFGGRVLGDEKPKYLNSPETPVFSKGRELYGLFEARQAVREAGFALVTEGYMDVVALAQFGFTNAVATLGTACTPEHLQKLFRFTSRVVFSFDGDAAGRRAARKALEGALQHATDGRTVRFLFLPQEHDPDSFIREQGTEAFSAALELAVPLSQFLVDAAGDGCDLATAEGRAQLLSTARPLWLQLPAGALRHQILGELASAARMDVRLLADLWGVAPPAAAPAALEPIGAGAPVARQPDPKRLARVLQIVLSEPQAWGWLSQDAQSALCALPAPYGPLFAWLDALQQEDGPQPWPALESALQGQEHAFVAIRAMAALPPGLDSDPAELQALLATQGP